MHFLLTGEPGVGKSTVLSSLCGLAKGALSGILSREIRSAGNERVGFEAVSADAPHERRIFAHLSAISADVKIGPYSVDLAAIDEFVVPKLRAALDAGRPICFDEIGRMQMLSPSFRALVADLMKRRALVFASIVYDPEPWSIPLKQDPSSILLRVSQKNRDQLPSLLAEFIGVSTLIKGLTSTQEALACKMLTSYFSTDSITQIQKFTHNTLRYLHAESVTKQAAGRYLVRGDHGEHLVIVDGSRFSCDCALSQGLDGYKAGECSHIQAVRLQQLL